LREKPIRHIKEVVEAVEALATQLVMVCEQLEALRAQLKLEGASREGGQRQQLQQQDAVLQQLTFIQQQQTVMMQGQNTLQPQLKRLQELLIMSGEQMRLARGNKICDTASKPAPEPAAPRHRAKPPQRPKPLERGRRVQLLRLASRTSILPRCT
jgi:regulator of replication initiation timing